MNAINTRSPESLGYENTHTYSLSPELTKVAKIIKEIAIAAFITIGILLNPLTNFVTQGLSDFLGLQTLRHGTSIQNYYSITRNGADPNHGGRSHGSSAGIHDIFPDLSKEYMKESENKFHVFADVPWTTKKDPLIAPLFVRIAPRLHALFSGYNSSVGKGVIQKVTATTSGIFSGVFSPTLKFRFLPEELKNIFEKDPDYTRIALRTTQKISPERLGLTGIFEQGIKGDIAARMKKDPLKTTIGAIQLFNPLGLVLLISFVAYSAIKSLGKPKLPEFIFQNS